MATLASPDSNPLLWLSLRLAPEMSRPRFHSLMSRYATPEAVYGDTAAHIAQVRGFDQALARAVLESRHTDVASRHADLLVREGGRIVTRQCADYPVNLTQSSIAPPLLFVKGTLQPEDKYAIAMVGSRHATQYGRGVSSMFAAGLAGYGMTVISGFARGIDGEAHNAAMKAGGRTLAVLGNGLDVCYPAEHRNLAAQVIESGALITEYPLGTAPERYNFPERNHVIAGLALGTIVVEAAEKSGSLITARLAVEENRFIFAVPGDITRNNSRGANSLIMQGARMVQRPQDVLIEMKAVLRGYLSEEAFEEETDVAPDAAATTKTSLAKRTKPAPDVEDSAAPDSTPPSQTDADAPSSETIETQKLSAAKPRPRPATKPTLTADETYIVELLRHEAMVFDEIAAQAYTRGIDTSKLTSLLMKLELRQVIRQLPGRYFVLFT